MNIEEERLKTFAGWPHPPINFKPTPQRLAASGFYMKPSDGFPDRTVCFCCGVALVTWTCNADPWEEHIRRSPSCGLCTGFHKAYCSEQTRLDSFKKWPLPSSYNATPSKLASAGFFLCPRGEFSDRSVCFCCGLALINWEPNDDPWTEHQNSSKICPFVAQLQTGNIPIVYEGEEKSESSLEGLITKLSDLGLDPATCSPPYFICPITQDIFLDPVVAEDGHTYDKYAIKRWFEHHNTSPLTNKKLYSKRVIPNHNLNTQILDYIEDLIEKNLPHDTTYTLSDILSDVKGKKSVEGTLSQ